MADLSKCMPVILTLEGGFSKRDRKADPGGVTLEGIIQSVYDGFRDRKKKPHRALTASMRGTADWIAERNEIYRTQYWNAVRGDELPAGIDLVVFDGAVNSGPYQSALWLQRALSAAGIYGGAIDGHIGAATLAAVEMCSDHDALIADVCARRLGMLRSLANYPQNKGGWNARVALIKKTAQAWAMGSVGPQPVFFVGASAKGYASDVVQPTFDVGTSTKISVGGTGVAGAVSQLQTQLEPFVGTSDLVTKIYTGLTVVGVAIAVGAAGYAFYADWRTKKAQRAIGGDLIADVPEMKFA